MEIRLSVQEELEGATTRLSIISWNLNINSMLMNFGVTPEYKQKALCCQISFDATFVQSTKDLLFTCCLKRK